jgi:GMP synthase-like glutamine amidotransferase
VGPLKVLSIVHGQNARSEIFGGVVEERGDALEEWSLAWGTPPPRPLDDYDAVLVFGGAMHADQDEHHPWLREENMLIQRLLHQHVPLLGVCLGAQLLAKAAHSAVGPATEPEIGWVEVEVTPEAADDSVFSRLPERFDAFEWHYYAYEVPAGAVELARSRVCSQAFRLGEEAWGVQFHPEVSREQVERWLADEDRDVEGSRDAIAAQTAERIEGWNTLGRKLCGAFLESAERIAVAA